MTLKLDRLLERMRDSSAQLFFLDDKGQETRRTFADLHCDALKLAADLQHLGIGCGSRIGILAANSYQWMVWDLAAIATGSILVALPQGQLIEPTEELLAQHGLSLLALDAAHTATAPTSRYVVDINAAQLPAEACARTCVPPPVPAGTHSLVFSSGTTGQTKGLIISGRGTERLVSLYGDAFGVVEGERFLSFLPFANYQQRMAYYFCLHHGIDFVYVPFPLLFASLKKYRPTYTIAPPILYESIHNLAQGLMASKPPGQATAGRVLSDILGGNIRYLITGMAPIKRKTLEFFWDNGLKLFEAFGITEAGMVTWNKPGSVKLGTVGRPAEPGSVTLTAEGEVVVTRDALLSLGYFESSAEDSRSTFVGDNSVATGDIACFDDEGFLTIVGRKKDAIITRSGEKFHPEPIESQIQGCTGVKVAVVTECEVMTGTLAIISIANADNLELKEEIRAQVAQLNHRLAPSQQVKECVFIDQDFTIENGLRTRNMKLNRKAIRARFLEPKASRNLAHS